MNVLKSISSSYVQHVIVNMILTLYLNITRTLSQSKVYMSQAFKLCHAMRQVETPGKVTTFVVREVTI